MSERLGWSFLLVTLVASMIMFFNLGGVPLLDPDEPVYAQTAREMISYDDFLSPRIYGEFWYDKPPMYYWLVAGSFKVFGVGEFAARFPSALLAIACVFYIYFACSRLFSQQSGLVSALVLATSIEFFYLGKAAVTDMTLTLFLTIALLSFLEKRYYWFYIGAALAVVTKGPIGIVFPVAIVFLYMIVTRNFSQLKKMKIIPGAGIFLVIALPWYWLMFQQHGMPFVDTFIGFHNVTRFLSPEHQEGAVWYYFIPVLACGFFPWTAVLAQAVWSAVFVSREESKKLMFLVIWAVFIFVFFSISKTKLPSYILPVFPPLAMIVGWYIPLVGDWRNRVRPIAWPLLLTIFSALLCVGLFFASKSMPELLVGVIVSICIFAMMAIGVWYFVWRLEIDKAFWLQISAMTLFSMVLLIMLLPQAAPKFNSRGIAAEFASHYDGKSPVYIAKFLHPGFTFYSGVYGQELKPGQFGQSAAGEGKEYFVVRKTDYDGLKPEEQRRLTALASIDGKMLLLKP